jgi:hypothetical protein
MIKWFEGNPVAIALAAMCAGMIVIALFLGVLWSLPPAASEIETGNESAVTSLNIPELEDSEPLETYAVITERPVFNESRLPVLDDDLTDEEGLAEEDEDVDAPDVQLSGVVITPSIRMAMLKSADLPRSLVAFEGQPLEGDFGSWQVSQIQAREVTLSSASGETLQLKLQVHDMKIAEPPKLETSPKEGEDEPESKKADSDEPLSRAEEIRQRIAQRREELRRAAEEKGEGEEPEIDYRTAIQSMTSGSRRKKEQDGN